MRYRSARGGALVAAAIAMLLLLLVWSIGIPNLGCGGPRAKSTVVQANVHDVQMAIEQWAVDHGGRYPASLEEFATVMSDKGYIEGGRIPKSPWGQQLRPLPAAGTVLRVPPDRVPSPMGTILGKGRQTAVIRAATDFGAILYAFDAKGRRYILYGIGKRRDDAVVVISLLGGAPR